MATPPTRGARGSGFGMRVHPIDGKYRMHYGEDGIGAGNYAPATGTVVFAGWDSTGHGFGWCVGIREATNSSVIWWVAHFGTSASVNPLKVAVGSRVTESVTYLGPSGTTGVAKGQHAHTERRVGGSVRPGSGTATDPRPHYSSPAGGGGSPIQPQVRKNKMTTVYYNGLSGSSAKWALAGDSPGTTANWIETGTQSLANSWAVVHGTSVNLVNQATFQDFAGWYKESIRTQSSGGLTTSQNAALMGLPAAVADLPTNGELGQALTSTVALVNDHADANKDAIIAAMPTGSGGGSSSYNLSLTIDEIPGTATGTATAN